MGNYGLVNPAWRKKTIKTNEFERAIKEKEFLVYYQPKIDTNTEKMVGAEALVRWKKADGTMISPALFVPSFEMDHRIEVLDEYVFKKVCQLQRKRLVRKENFFPISVNLSRKSLYSNDIVERYSRYIEENEIPFSCVPIEITESAAIEDDKIRKNAERLVEKGFVLQLDDFGSGFSSLMSLSSLPFSAIKLDKHLIDGVTSEKGKAIVAQTIILAKLLNMEVVAEGVETKKQAEILKNIGCHTIQGFYYCPPMPEAVFCEKV